MNAVVVIDRPTRTAVVLSPDKPHPIAVTQDRARASVVVVERSTRTAVVLSPDRPHPLAVTQDIARASVVVKGFQGVPGPKGAPGDSSAATGRAVVPFAFGDASPLPVFTPAVNCTDILVRLVIDTPFNGAGAALKLGTVAQPEALLAASHNDPTAAGGYEAAPDAALVAGVPIVLSIVPGTGATQGAGRAIFDSING